MSSPLAPSRRRWKPVRLVEVPLDQRVRAAREACRREPDPDERARIFALALDPRDLVAYVAP